MLWWRRHTAPYKSLAIKTMHAVMWDDSVLLFSTRENNGLARKKRRSVAVVGYICTTNSLAVIRPAVTDSTKSSRSKAKSCPEGSLPHSHDPVSGQTTEADGTNPPQPFKVHINSMHPSRACLPNGLFLPHFRSLYIMHLIFSRLSHPSRFDQPFIRWTAYIFRLLFMHLFSRFLLLLLS